MFAKNKVWVICCGMRCRYTSTASLEALGQAFEQAMQLLQRYHLAFAEQMRQPVRDLDGEPALDEDTVLNGRALMESVVRPIGKYCSHRFAHRMIQAIDMDRHCCIELIIPHHRGC